MCQRYRPFILKLLGNHCLNIARLTIQKKHQLWLKSEKELRKLQNHYYNSEEVSVTHHKKEAKQRRSMKLHMKNWYRVKWKKFEYDIALAEITARLVLVA
ncbi:putative ATP-dependent DNA helicase RecG [Trichinella spiralis]|uniref:putative ATP-dependent DNA helicase RecG n=1 Tax=Trichinella spiralis TaxID=6334 RepID=UPI0001EFEC70|nr:putative ATP-dependent DNA helicase RecG [Trichinella spiralis]